VVSEAAAPTVAGADSAVGHPDAFAHRPDPGSDAGPADGTGTWHTRWRIWWPWLVGIAAGLVTLGPALAPGSLFSLDLVLTPQVPVPDGVWGLGPELPRRVPLMLPVAWLSPIIPGWLTGKVMIVASIAVAFVGVHRLVRDRGELAATGAGLLYAINPFMLTRISVGHLALVVGMALMPWALPSLLRPGDRLSRTFLWSFALGFSGYYGGMVSLVLVVAGLCNTRMRESVKVLGLWVVAQLPWLVPGLIVMNQGGGITDASSFTTIGRGVAGKAQILAGHGFWNFRYQSGFTGEQQHLGDQLLVAIPAFVLLGLAVIGARDLPREWRWASTALAGVGALLAVLSSFEYDANPYFALTRNPIGANLRESQRALPLYLVWMAPAAALGALRLARKITGRFSGHSSFVAACAWVIRAVPLGAALYLAAPGMWGLEGHLRSAQIPPGWEAVRSQVQDAPGAVVVLPWSAYNDYDLGGPHRVISPWPFYLGGDVLICSDPGRSSECGSGSEVAERADAREDAAGRLASASTEGHPIADGLADLGVRWVLLAHVPGAERYDLDEPGLERVVTSDSVDLYRVLRWRGMVVDAQGREVPSESLIGPVRRTDPSGPATLARAATPGWLRGLETAGTTANGLVELPEGGGLIWYWPVLVVLLGDVTCGVAVVIAVRGELRRKPGPDTSDTHRTDPVPLSASQG